MILIICKNYRQTALTVEGPRSKLRGINKDRILIIRCKQRGIKPNEIKYKFRKPEEFLNSMIKLGQEQEQEKQT